MLGFSFCHFREHEEQRDVAVWCCCFSFNLFREGSGKVLGRKVSEKVLGRFGMVVDKVVCIKEISNFLPSLFNAMFSTGEVTHHWGNRFCHLVAAVIGDSLHLSRWDSVAEQLIAGDLKPLKKRLRHCGSEDWQHLATVLTYFMLIYHIIISCLVGKLDYQHINVRK